MNNNIEILRAFCFDYDDIKTISNFGDSFSKLEIDFMVEFKKIYELGTDQLKKFIDKLDNEGSELDVYSIQYYVDILTRGPLASYVFEYAKDKKYFMELSDSIGSIAMISSTSTNTTVYPDGRYPLGTGVDVFNSFPLYMQLGLLRVVVEVEDVFRSSLKSSYEVDNTKPIIDKEQQQRYTDESKGKWTKKANGTYLVKDSNYYLTVNEISLSVFDKIKEQLGEDEFRVYIEKKDYNPFDGKLNTSKAMANKITKKITQGEDDDVVEHEVDYDLMGDEFDSVDKRKSSLIVSSDDKDVEYKLNTVQGQLGD